MQMLQPTSETTKVEKTTETVYPIDGFNPDMVVLRVTTTTTNDNKPNIYYQLLYGIGTRYKPKLVTQEFFELIKKCNPFDTSGEEFKSCIIDVEDVVIMDDDNTVYMDLGGLEMVWLNYSSSIIMDKEGLFIPYARTYDYCGTYFNNEDIDFSDGFFDFLRNHPWVVNKDDIKVEKIPYYNQHEGRDETVTVVVCPDKETYNKMADYAKKEKGGYRCLSLLSSFIVSNYASKKDWFGLAPYLKNGRTFEM
jgi:hypothetical protein